MPHECPHPNCNRVYKKKKDLADHLRSKKHDPNKLLALKCDRCTETFRNRVSLRQHKRRVHDKELPKFQCNLCAYDTDQANNLTRHKRAVHACIKNLFKKVQCPLCATELVSTSLARHMRGACPFSERNRSS